MKFLVLGASGFLGRSTYAYLKSQGYKTLGTQYSSSYSELIPFNLAEDRIEKVIEPTFFHSHEPKFAIIFAGFTDTDRCFREKDLSHKVNVTNTILLIEDLIRLGVKPVYISTSAVFDGKKGNYKEDDQPSPLSVYAHQKWDIEKFIIKNCPNSLIVRLDKVIGDDPSSNHIFTEWYRLAEKLQPIYCIEDQEFGPTHVDDVGKALVDLCEKNCSGTYHVANPDSVTRVALAEKFFKKLGKKTEIVALPQSKLNLLEKRPPRSYLNVEKLIKQTGMVFTSIEEVIEIFIQKLKGEEHKDHQSSCVRRSDCRLCHSSDLELILKFVPTPVGDSYVPVEKVHQKQERFPLELFLCASCGCAQLLDVVNPKILYSNYIYQTSISLGLAEHFNRYAKEVLDYLKPEQGSLVIDIGSNDGTLLKAFKRQGMRVLGIDPAPEASKSANAAGIETLNDYFCGELARKIYKQHGPPAIITANNVIANIDDLSSFIQGIRTLLSANGCFVFETGYMVDFIQGKLIDTIYHEHLSYFTVSSMDKFFCEQGMELIYAQHISTKGGSFRAIAQLKGGKRTISPLVQQMIQEEKRMEVGFPSIYKKISKEVEEWKIQLSALLNNIKSQGKTVAGYGASVGVTTLLYLFDLANKLDYILDDNPARYNLYTPGHHLLVVSSDEIYKRNPDYVLILAWRYNEPIIKRHEKFLNEGGQFILFFPKLEIVSGAQFNQNAVQ